MWGKAFWKATSERAIKTFAQALGAVLLGSYSGLLEVDWRVSLSVSGMAALISLLTSIGSGAIGEDGPSFLSNEILN